MNHSRTALSFAALASITLAGIAGCGGGPGDDCVATNQEEALGCLGVPEDDTPRHDTTGAALPESYAPLGTTAAVGVSAEVFLVGMRIAPPTPTGPGTPLANRAVTVALADDLTGARGTTVLDAVAPGSAWELDTTSPERSGQSTRAAAAADLDGDGRAGPVVAYLGPADAAQTGVVFIERVGVATPQATVTMTGARDLALVAADVDGDGLDELVLGVTTPAGGRVFVIDVDDAGRFVTLDGATLDLPMVAGGASSIELAAGNLDRDRGDEVAIVFNEEGNGGASSYSVLDDAGADFAPLVFREALRVQDGGSFLAVVADVAIGDVDADGKGEIVLGGLTELATTSCRSFQHVYQVLDDAGDAPAPLAPIAQKAELLRYVPPSGCSDVTMNLPARHVFVNTLDLDGDGVDEIQANLRVFDDLRAGDFAELYTIDQAVLAGADGRGGAPLTTSTTAMAVADIDGNGRDEILIFAQHMGQLVVWGIDGSDTAVFRQQLVLPTDRYNSQSRVFPIVMPVNVDDDGAVLKYSEATHRFVFTEPVVIAAVAAAPCVEGIGQNLAACTTSYGLSQAVSGGIDASVTVSAGAFVSFEAKDPFFGIGAEGRASVTASASFSASRAYQLEETVEYTTGPLEDTVIFTTLPLDRYTYTIVAHPDATLVGTSVTVNLPRAPVTLQVERTFYNDHVAPGSLQVASNVFFHTPGQLDSYPTEADADLLIATGGRARLGPLGDVVDLLGEPLGDLIDTLLGAGIKASRPITVGQGGGQTTTEIVFSQSTDYRAGAEIAFEAELAVTGGGVGVGTTIGGSVGAGLSWGSSSSTIYRGSIGSIDAANFADNLYSAGLFTYVHSYGDTEARQFEVVNYWVARQVAP